VRIPIVRRRGPNADLCRSVRSSGHRLLGIWLVSTSILFCLSVAWSFATPIGAAQDEPSQLVKASSVARGEIVALFSGAGAGELRTLCQPVLLPAFPNGAGRLCPGLPQLGKGNICTDVPGTLSTALLRHSRPSFACLALRCGRISDATCERIADHAVPGVSVRVGHTLEQVAVASTGNSGDGHPHGGHAWIQRQSQRSGVRYSHLRLDGRANPRA
jgi:hypothetical protein